MNKNKYQNKSPKDLTIGEISDILTEIAKYEYNKRSDIQQIQDYNDVAQEVITYMLEKQARGKKGLKELQEKCTMAHFMNILHLECRNNINYIIRKKKTQRYLYNTDLLSTPVGGNESEDVIRTLEHVIPDSKYLDELDINLELQDILSNIDNNESNRIVIKYRNGDNECIFKFSYKNLIKTYFDLYTNKKFTTKNIQELLYDPRTNMRLSEHRTKDIIKRFKSYMIENEILGGLAK